jgi:hypothetical protein
VVSSSQRFSLPPLIRFSSPALLVRDTSTQGIFFFQFSFHPFSQARSKIRFCFSCR